MVWISLTASILVGFSSEFTNVLSMRRTVAFFVFFLLGYRFDKERFSAFLQRRTVKCYALTAFVVLLVCIGCFAVVREMNMSTSVFLAGRYYSMKDLYRRIVFFSISFAAIAGMMLTVPNREMPLLTGIGRNSLLIYLGHRFVTFGFSDIFPVETYSREYVVYALIASFVTVLVLGSNAINSRVNRFFGNAAEALFEEESRYGHALKLGIALCTLSLMSIYAWQVASAW